MNPSTSRFSIRKNFILLLLLSISAAIVLCWFSFVFLVIATGGPIFQDRSQVGMDFFLAFIFPFFLGVAISIFSLILTAVVRQKWWIAVPASIFLLGLPLAAYVVTWLGSWIARLFYIPTPEDAERTKQFLSMSVSPKEDKPDPDVETIKKMKLLLEEGIITQEEFAAQKQKILSAVSSEATAQSLPRFFSIWQATAAALLGGFLAGAILISMDFKRLGDKDRFKGALVIGIVGFLISILLSAVTMMFIGTDLYPVMIIAVTLVYPIVIYLWHNEALKPTIASLVEAKQARSESWWLVLGVCCLVLVFNYLSVIPAALLLAYFQPAVIK